MIPGMSLSGSVLRFVLPKAAPEPEQLTIVHAGDTLPVTFVRSRRARRASLRVDPAGRRIGLTAPLRIARGTALGLPHAPPRRRRPPPHTPSAPAAVPPRPRGAVVRRAARRPSPARQARYGVARAGR